MNLISFFETAIMALNRNKSAELGDRTQYIGSSDVGSCARKVYHQKMDPTEPDFCTMMRFSRGHVAEMLIDAMFTAAGAENLYDTQVEVIHPDHPLKAHIDFLFYANFAGKKQLHIVEVKSVSGIPDEPYPQWIDQLNFQLGLLRLKYPKRKLGGSILVIDLNAGKIHQFNGFEYNATLFSYLCKRGLHMLECIKGNEEPVPTTSFLCSFCSYRSDCPAMALAEVELPPEIEAMGNKYIQLSDIRSEADRRMRTIRDELLAFTGPVFKGRSDTIELIASMVGPSTMVDSQLLRREYPDVYTNVLKERAGYTKLECRPAH